MAATWPKEGEIKKLGEELATLNRKIQLTLKPVGRHENVEGKETGAEEQRLVSGSDVTPDLPRQAKHVPSMEIVNPARELKNILMFPAAHCCNPRKLRRLHFRRLQQRAAFQERTKARPAPG